MGAVKGGTHVGGAAGKALTELFDLARTTRTPSALSRGIKHALSLCIYTNGSGVNQVAAASDRFYRLCVSEIEPFSEMDCAIRSISTRDDDGLF